MELLSESYKCLNLVICLIRNNVNFEPLFGSNNYLHFLLFLQNFRQLKSISLKFTCQANLFSSSLFNLKVKFTDSGDLVLISVISSRLYNVIEQGYNFGSRDGTFCKTK